MLGDAHLANAAAGRSLGAKSRASPLLLGKGASVGELHLSLAAKGCDGAGMGKRASPPLPTQPPHGC